MPLVIRNGKLLIGSDGKLTTNQDCCCEECDCSTADTVDYSCKCINADYGTIYTVSDLTVTFGGSVSATGNKPRAELSDPAPCIFPSGSFVVPCPAQHYFAQCVYWDTDDSGNDWYVCIRIIIEWSFRVTSPLREPNIEVWMHHQQFTTNPYPSMTALGTTDPPEFLYAGGESIKTWEVDPLSSFRHWRYVHEGACREECDPGIDVTACFASPITWDTVDYSESLSASCDLSLLTLSAEFTKS